MSGLAAQHPPAEPLVRVRHVGKVFRRRGYVTQALRDVDLTIDRGELLALLGPSGCGKSTLLRVIGGLLPADTGEVLVGGVDPAEARAAKQFGLVPQSPALVPWRTVEDNVRFLTELNRHGGDHEALSPEAVAGLLADVGLAPFRRAYPRELSGGLRQRVSLVRAFALGAPILLMDEPFAALDEITRSDMRYLLLELWQRTGATVLFVTHSVTEAVILSDRVAVMAPRPGRVAAVEPVLLGRPRRPGMEDSDDFHEHVRRVRAHLREHHEP